MSVTTAEMVTLTLPAELVREIDQASVEAGLSRETLLRAAVHQFARGHESWQRVQAAGAKRAAELGLHTEEDVVAFVEAFLEEDDA